MTLGKLLELRDLELELVCGEKELGRNIRWVYTTDLVDPARYLRGSELVLTSGLWYTAPDQCERFVASLASRGAAALVIGLAQMKAMPPELPEACERHGLPLFTLPEEVSFGSISEAVIGELSDERDASLARSLGRHKRLLTLIATGRSVDGLLEFLADDLGIASYLFTPLGRVASAWAPELDRQEAFQVFRAAVTTAVLPGRIRRRTNVDYSAFKVDSPEHDGVVHGYLLCRGDYLRWPPDIAETVEVVVNLIAVELAAASAERRREAQRAGSFFGSLLESELTRGEVRAHLSSFGLDPGVPLIGLAGTAGARGDVDALVSFLDYSLSDLVESRVVGAVDGQVLALLSTWFLPEEIAVHLRQAAEVHEGRQEPYAIGLSGATGELTALAELLAEARRAASFAASTAGRGVQVVESSEVSSHAVLLAATPARVRKAFYGSVLGRLVEYDRRHKSQLEQTLALLLAHGGASREVAADLQIHVNTLRYRLTRIEELTGKKFSSTADRADLLLALTCGQVN